MLILTCFETGREVGIPFPIYGMFPENDTKDAGWEIHFKSGDEVDSYVVKESPSELIKKIQEMNGGI